VYMIVLLGVAFFTLLERKILSYVHNRVGPNRVGFYGVFQPFRDALKLFTKEDLKFSLLNFYIYLFSPILGLFISLILWRFFRFWGIIFYNFYRFILFFCIRSLSVYFLLLRGWSRGSKYGFLGGYRSSAQSISYEVVIVFIFIVVCILNFNYSFRSFDFYSYGIFYFYLFPIVFICWLFSCLAECNRSPFDFSEGESELVSGFNTEFGGGIFSLVFIGEYASILFLSFITGLIFYCSGYIVYIFGLLISFFYLWVRSSFPRLRYDKLMISAWKGLIIYIFGYFLFFLIFMYM